MTDEEFAEWLKDQTAIRCILVEVNVKTGGSETTRYLSTRGYVTKSTETPASTIYSPVIAGGVKFSQSMSLDGSVTISFGDIELNNTDGSLDSWLEDYWNIRSIRVFIGDVTWVRSDFRQIFNGVVVGIDTRKRDRINIKLSDKLQRLNNPATETKLGGTTTNSDRLLPLCFGECHNVEPLLVDPTTHEYQVHQGLIEGIIEVRDNGVPVSFTPYLSTGKFRLTNNPVGQITASVQGAVPATNLLLRSQEFDNSYWTKSGTTVTPNATTAPDGTTTADFLVENTALAAPHSLTRVVSLDPSQTHTLTFYAKAAGRRYIRLQVQDGGTTAIRAWFDLQDGVVTLAQNFGNGTGATASIDSVGSGWYRCRLSGVADSTGGTSVTVVFYLISALNGSANYDGDGASGAYVWGAQLELSPYARSYSVTTSAAANIYVNTVAEIVKLLTTGYGNTATRFTVTDLDLSSLHTFDAANIQPVGIYLGDRSNVLEACNQLATSVGARLVMSSAGVMSLVKLSLPQGSAGTSVTSAQMADRSLEVSQLPPVKAGVQLGYCKNWTVQNSLATGVVAEHMSMYAEEWLTLTRTDSTAATNFNLFTEPVMEETLLLTAADALTEADRRLNMFKVQRKVLKYKGYADLLLEELGDPQTIQHSRFGLSGGVTGQIISVATDWINQRVEIETLI